MARAALEGLVIPGQVFGRWTAVRFVERNAKREAVWLCVCACGTERHVVAPSLRNGGSQSCGCLRPDQLTKHGCAPFRGPCTPEYGSWSAAKGRCYNTREPSYDRYGGRGITMALEWRNDFARFLVDMGPCPPGHTLDRYPDNNGPYAPGNCRWATIVEQNRNKRSVKRVTFDGETLCYPEWDERLGFRAGTVITRLRNGWGVKRALTEPVRKRWSMQCAHPEKPHKSRGLCVNCYARVLRAERRERAYA